jgi:hypothetical protein
MAVYSMMSWLAKSRRRSVALQLALGSSRWRAVYSLLKEVFGVVAVGAACGVPGGYALTRWFDSLIGGVRPDDWVLYGGMVAVVGAMSLGASLLPMVAVLRQPLRSLLSEN